MRHIGFVTIFFLASFSAIAESSIDMPSVDFEMVNYLNPCLRNIDTKQEKCIASYRMYGVSIDIPLFPYISGGFHWRAGLPEGGTLGVNFYNFWRFQYPFDLPIGRVSPYVEAVPLGVSVYQSFQESMFASVIDIPESISSGIGQPADHFSINPTAVGFHGGASLGIEYSPLPYIAIYAHGGISADVMLPNIQRSHAIPIEVSQIGTRYERSTTTEQWVPVLMWQPMWALGLKISL